MNWIPLKDINDIDKIKQDSIAKAQVIFKHSTRCSISSMAKSRLDRSSIPEDVDFHYLDLIAHKALSAAVAQQFSVHHESPQILVIKNGECVYDESHSGISMDEIEEIAKK